jgi:hypothetical protein
MIEPLDDEPEPIWLSVFHAFLETAIVVVAGSIVLLLLGYLP